MRADSPERMWNTATATTATPAPLPAITSTTNHHIITLPHFSHTHPFRNIDIHISLITTIDALCSKFLGSNARPNLDIFAPNISQSFCAPYTLQPFDTLALFNGLYFHNLSNMGEAVALAASQQSLCHIHHTNPTRHTPSHTIQQKQTTHSLVQLPHAA